MTRIRIKGAALTLAAAFAAFACTSSPTTGTGTETLAADQILRIPLTDDVTSLDPAHVDAAVDIAFLQEVFTGLYKFDKTLKIVPDGTTALPDISSDGKTYTFHLRKDMKFSNGDKITSKDWIYSWTRTASINDAYASNLEPISGDLDVESGKAKTISGLSAPDDYTLVAKLTDPAGYWMTQLAMPTATQVLSQKAIEAGGADTWWQKPESYVGSGPFKMTSRVAKSVMEFDPVASWWGGSTGALKKVHIDIGVDQASQVKKFESGGYENVGFANQAPTPDDILRYKNDPTKSKMLHLYPGARTTAVGFNFVKGPFAPKQGVTPGQQTAGTGITDPNKAGRLAFAQAVDRAQLVDVACAKGATCAVADVGWISKGLKGTLKPGEDMSAKFDSAAAKAAYTKWDPDGSKVKGLQYRFNSTGSNTARAGNLQSQWKANLGINVDLAPSDFPTLQKDRKAKLPVIGRESWSADYDHPQDWYDNLATCAQAKVGRGNDEAYCNPDMDKLVAQADAEPSLDKAVATYVQANKLFQNDIAWMNLDYGTQTYLTQTYVSGMGFNSLYDYNWEGTKILKH
jgi:ABC-type oligopeptide transport system substrate-binding subunit